MGGRHGGWRGDKEDEGGDREAVGEKTGSLADNEHFHLSLILTEREREGERAIARARARERVCVCQRDVMLDIFLI